jgi:WD40 repeat protein
MISQQDVFGKTISSCHLLKNTVGVQINEMTFSYIRSSFFSRTFPLFNLLSMSTVQFTIYRHEGPLMLPKLHEGSIAACYMSNDSKLLITGGYDLKVILWDIENMTHKLVLRVREIQMVSFLM